MPQRPAHRAHPVSPLALSARAAQLLLILGGPGILPLLHGCTNILKGLMKPIHKLVFGKNAVVFLWDTDRFKSGNPVVTPAC